MSDTYQEAYNKKVSQSKWWCPKCNSYRLPQEVKVIETHSATDWDDFTDYALVCGQCNAFVREPDLSNCTEVIINFVDGAKWEDVRNHLNAAQINILSLLCGEWKLGHMSQEQKREYEQILALKDVNKFSEFVSRWNYQVR